MSVLTDVLDRLTDITTLRAQVTELIGQQREMRGLMLTQQKELAELRGQLKALNEFNAQNKRGQLVPNTIFNDRIYSYFNWDYEFAKG